MVPPCGGWGGAVPDQARLQQEGYGCKVAGLELVAGEVPTSWERVQQSWSLLPNCRAQVESQFLCLSAWAQWK